MFFQQGEKTNIFRGFFSLTYIKYLILVMLDELLSRKVYIPRLTLGEALNF